MTHKNGITAYVSSCNRLRRKLLHGTQPGLKTFLKFLLHSPSTAEPNEADCDTVNSVRS